MEGCSWGPKAARRCTATRSGKTASCAMAASCLERLAGRPQTPMVQQSQQQQQEDAGARRVQQRWAAHVPAARDFSSPGRGAAQQHKCDLEKESSRKATSWRATQISGCQMSISRSLYFLVHRSRLIGCGARIKHRKTSVRLRLSFFFFFFFFSFSFSSFSRESNRKRTRALARHGAHPPSAKSVGC